MEFNHKLPDRDSRPRPRGPRIFHLSGLFTVEVARASRRVTIQLCGELDFATVAELWSSLPGLSSDVAQVEVDLSRLEFCDIAGMRAVDELCAEQRKAGRSVQVTGARPYFRKVARISGLVPQAVEG